MSNIDNYKKLELKEDSHFEFYIDLNHWGIQLSYDYQEWEKLKDEVQINVLCFNVYFRC